MLPSINHLALKVMLGLLCVVSVLPLNLIIYCCFQYVCLIGCESTYRKNIQQNLDYFSSLSLIYIGTKHQTKIFLVQLDPARDTTMIRNNYTWRFNH